MDETSYPIDQGLVIGHSIGGTVLASFGVFGLILTWKRLAALSSTTTTAGVISFDSPQQHVLAPNNDDDDDAKSLKVTIAKTIMVTTGIGWWVEALGACIDNRIETDHCLLFQFGHEILYTMYFVVGPVLWLEASGRLPLDSWRVMLGVSSVLVAFFWMSHANLKDGADAMIHSYLGLISMTCAIAIAYSVTHPENLFSYMAVFGCLILNGMWLFTSAMTFAFGMLPLHMVVPVFCLEASGLTLLLMVIHAMIGIPQAPAALQQHELATTKMDGFAPLCSTITNNNCNDDDGTEEEETV